jgi:hypothetical protein
LAAAFFVDEIYGNVVYLGHPDLPTVPRGTLDDEWLAVVGGEGRGFVLTGRRSQSTADSLALLEQHWDQIGGLRLTSPARPWMMSITAAGIRPDSLL